MNDKLAYLVFDIETVADGRLVQRVRYPEQPQLTPAEAVARYRADLLAASGGKSDFVPHTFQVPVSIAIAKVAADHSLIEVRTLDRPKFRPQVITRSFWRGWEKHGQPTLVTFNGRFFDLPVLELSAYRYGIAVPPWFSTELRQYEQPRKPLQHTRAPRPAGCHRQSGRDARQRRSQPVRQAGRRAGQDGHQGRHGAGAVGARRTRAHR